MFYIVIINKVSVVRSFICKKYNQLWLYNHWLGFKKVL